MDLSEIDPSRLVDRLSATWAVSREPVWAGRELWPPACRSVSPEAVPLARAHQETTSTEGLGGSAAIVCVVFEQQHYWNFIGAFVKHDRENHVNGNGFPLWHNQRPTLAT